RRRAAPYASRRAPGRAPAALSEQVRVQNPWAFSRPAFGRVTEPSINATALVRAAARRLLEGECHHKWPACDGGPARKRVDSDGGQTRGTAPGCVLETAGEGPSWPDDVDLVRRCGRGDGARAFKFSQVSPRCAGTLVALPCGRSAVRPGALSQGLFRHAALQAGGGGARRPVRPPRRRALRARLWPRRRRASSPMWRLWTPGVPAISTARSRFGKRSSPIIPPTRSRSGSRI